MCMCIITISLHISYIDVCIYIYAIHMFQNPAKDCYIFRKQGQVQEAWQRQKHTKTKCQLTGVLSIGQHPRWRVQQGFWIYHPYKRHNKTKKYWNKKWVGKNHLLWFPNFFPWFSQSSSNEVSQRNAHPIGIVMTTESHNPPCSNCWAAGRPETLRCQWW